MIALETASLGEGRRATVPRIALSPSHCIRASHIILKHPERCHLDLPPPPINPSGSFSSTESTESSIVHVLVPRYDSPKVGNVRLQVETSGELFSGRLGFVGFVFLEGRIRIPDFSEGGGTLTETPTELFHAEGNGQYLIISYHFSAIVCISEVLS